jgi:hypothetical protein
MFPVNLKKMPDKKLKVRLIAFYLPQYHTIPENDKWWGKGFTDWDTVRKAKPLFKGHWQPHIPGELGYYNLLDPGVREKQAELAREHGIEGFCYYHYWLGGGKRLLERPFEEVLTSGRPDFPFCLAWANHPWAATWFGAGDRLLIEQVYPGKEDYKAHFEYLLKAFRDPRYIRVNGKPLFYICLPVNIPEIKKVADLWNSLANKAGLNGIHCIGENISQDRQKEMGLDSSCYVRHRHIGFLNRNKSIFINLKIISKKLLFSYIQTPEIYSFPEAMKFFIHPASSNINVYPSIVPNWDNTPRMDRKGVVLTGATPELFREHVRDVLKKIEHKPFENRIAFIKSWNEWAEGNYLEPDQKFGRRYLEVLKEEVLC